MQLFYPLGYRSQVKQSWESTGTFVHTLGMVEHQLLSIIYFPLADIESMLHEVLDSV